MPAIIFDLDETLLDRTASFQQYAVTLFATFPPAVTMSETAFVQRVQQLDGHGQVPRAVFFTHLARELLADLSPDHLQAHFYATAWTQPQLFPGVRDVLDTFRQRAWKIGIITNGGVVAQSAKLVHSGLIDLVDTWVISEAFGCKKPDPSIYHYTLNGLAIDPAHAWFVGDDPVADIWGAKQVGCRTAWVPRTLPWPEDLAPCYDLMLNDIRGVMQIIEHDR